MASGGDCIKRLNKKNNPYWECIVCKGDKKWTCVIASYEHVYNTKHAGQVHWALYGDPGEGMELAVTLPLCAAILDAKPPSSDAEEVGSAAAALAEPRLAIEDGSAAPHSSAAASGGPRDAEARALQEDAQDEDDDDEDAQEQTDPAGSMGLARRSKGTKSDAIDEWVKARAKTRANEFFRNDSEIRRRRIAQVEDDKDSEQGEDDEAHEQPGRGPPMPPRHPPPRQA